MEELVWFGDRLIPVSEVRLSPFDRGFLYGDGLFETMRSYGGGVHLLRRHLCRLRSGGGVLGLHVPSDEELCGAIAALLAGSEGEDCRVRLTLSRGIDPDGEPTLLIRRQPLLQRLEIQHGGSRQEETLLVPEELSLLPHRRTPPEIFPRLKSLNYLPEILAQDLLRRRGLREGLFLTPDGFVAEGSVSNLFCVIRGELLTPPVDLGILPGITRERLIELAREEGIPVAERPFTLDEFLNADECFYTNSIREIVPIGSVEGKPIGKGECGPVTLRLYERYRREAPDENL